MCVAAYLCSEVLGHAGLLDEGSPSFLQTSSVVREQPCSLDLRGHVGDLVLHPLEERHHNVNVSVSSAHPLLLQAQKLLLKPTWKSKMRFPNWTLCLVYGIVQSKQPCASPSICNTNKVSRGTLPFFTVSY